MYRHIGETDHRIKDRIVDDNNGDKNSHMLKRSSEEGHSHVWEKNFKLLRNNYCTVFKQKFREALFRTILMWKKNWFSYTFFNEF